MAESESNVWDMEEAFDSTCHCDSSKMIQFISADQDIQSADQDVKETNMWAWWDAFSESFCHIYPSKACVEMCFPDGGKHKTELGLGKIVEVVVKTKTK